MFFALGPSVTAGKLNRVVRAIDFAPTFAKILGVDTDVFDGHPIEELCAVATPPRTAEVSATP